MPPLIQTLGSKSIAHVPWIIIVAALFLLVAHLVLTYTRFGRYVYMVGGNREAAEYSGVNTRSVVGAVMVISAMCSGVAGMIGVAYFGSAQQNEFDTFLLDAIAAVVVGGTSLFGGRGGIGNTIVGLFVLGVLNNGLDYVKIDSFLKILIRGLILLTALIINIYAERLRGRAGRRLRRHAMMAAPMWPSTTLSCPRSSPSLPEVRAKLGGEPAEWRVREVGDGNLNLVFIVEGPAGGLVVKQALPYVRLVGESWPLPLERSWFEYNALVEQARYAPRLTPKIFHFDREQAMIVMEYLSPHIIMRKVLIRGDRISALRRRYRRVSRRDALQHLRAGRQARPSISARIELFARNIELCRITEDLVFTDPYREAPLNRWTSPQLDADKRAFENDAPLKAAAQARKYQFLTAGQALIHGDLHTGSIMLTTADTRVIDPEFAFVGPIGFDVGAVIGNLLLAYFAQEGHEASPGARDSYRVWILDQVAAVWTGFHDRFLALWRQAGRGDAYVAGLFASPRDDAALETERSRFMRALFEDSLAFGGLKMIRRILGLAHVEDLETIADAGLRAVCERKALRLARELVLEGAKFSERRRRHDAARAVAAASRALAGTTASSHLACPYRPHTARSSRRCRGDF